MHTPQRQVEEFHRALDIPVGDSPGLRRPELRAELLREETKETVEAIERGDLVEAIDGLCDVIVVAYGAAVEFGIDLEPFFEEVHRTNMAKKDGPVREDGKRLKPPGWQPPDIAGILERTVVGAPRGHVERRLLAEFIDAAYGKNGRDIWSIVREAQEAVENPVSPATLDATEQRAMDLLSELMRILCDTWQLHEGNNLRDEMALYIHGLQGFIVQHMLQRLGGWGEWYDDPDLA